MRGKGRFKINTERTNDLKFETGDFRTTFWNSYNLRRSREEKLYLRKKKPHFRVQGGSAKRVEAPFSPLGTTSISPLGINTLLSRRILLSTANDYVRFGGGRGAPQQCCQSTFLFTC